ncbi:hypothetical protein [Hahella ganghwensis]|uniref:hypothetical protein n=1 Tax=Hahella ganghwensis TaxID=286420 RepID=UPI000360D212|nr:hypothetical protein [Hahella ganghwensis]
MITTDFYLKLIDPTGRHSPVITHHRVWNRDRFIAAQKRYHEDKKRGDEIRVVSEVSETEYLALKRGKAA